MKFQKDLILQKMNEENISLSDSEKEIIFDRLQMPLKGFVGLFIAKMVCLWKGGGVSYSMEYLEPIHPFLCKTVELFNAFIISFTLIYFKNIQKKRLSHHAKAFTS